MNVPEIFRTKIARAIGIKSKNLTIRLRKPLEIQSNRLYDIWVDDSHFIGKEFLKANELEDAPLREYQALRLSSPLDIAPKPVFYEADKGPLVIYEYMEGEMWDRQAPTASGLAKLMEIWLKMNTLPADWISRGHERSLKKIEDEFYQGLKTYAE
jgi:hypothetical protein